MQQRIYKPFPWEDPPKKYAEPDSIFFGRLSKVTEANITTKQLSEFDDSLLFYQKASRRPLPDFVRWGMN